MHSEPSSQPGTWLRSMVNDPSLKKVSNMGQNTVRDKKLVLDLESFLKKTIGKIGT